MNNEQKLQQYSFLIKNQIAEMFTEGAENFIDKNDLEDYANEFFHALANIAPCWIYNTLTDNDENFLTFNHIANHLVFQFSKHE